MIKKTIFTTVLLLFATIASAQFNSSDDNRTRIQYGLKAGATFSNVYDSDDEAFQADPKIGFTGGAFLKIPIGRYLGVQPELLFTQKGYKGNGSFLGVDYGYSRTSSFVEVPLLVAIQPVEYVTILAGPSFSYLVSQKNNFSSSIVTTEQEEEYQQDNIRKNILGIVGGLDINIFPAVVGIRVGWDLQDNKGDGTSTQPRYKNVSSQLTLGFKF